ncbi:MAG: T9SS type B sorting domain-containing protein, partial [Bacteroidia bacterium]
ITATITPTNPIICSSSGTSITLSVTPSGGALPYNYQWNGSPSNNGPTYTTNVAGTYTVVVGDKTKCPKVSFVKTIAAQPSATFTFSSAGYCKNGTNPSPIYTGTGQAGSFSALPAGLSFVSTTTGQVNLAGSTPGTYTVTNTIPASGGCPGTSSTATVNIYAFPTMTSVSSATICSGGTVNIPLTSSMGSTYTWFASDNANTTGESITTQTTSTLNNTITNNLGSQQNVIYTVTPTATVSGSCAGTPQTVIVVVNPMDNPAFTYSPATFCQSGSNPTPVITGLSGGTFSGTGGLVFANTSTGTINLSANAIGTYTVTYNTNGVCPNSQSVPVTITTAPSAAFSYTATPYCQNSTNPLPNFGSGASAGSFSSGAGLVFVNTGTGEVNLAASTPGTYTVTNTIPASGGCSVATATTVITITALKVATFNYPATPYCKNASNPSPVYTGGGVAGIFTSQAGLSLNSSTGQVNLSASTPGTYTVTNTVAATGGCPAVVATSTIQITDLPIATFTYNATPYCQTAGNPSPVFYGGGVAGGFSASSVFLNINSSTGTIDLNGSQAGGYIITNTIPAANGCPLVSASASVTITALPVGSFSYSSNPYCQNGTDPTPVLISGGTNGTYTGSPSGLSIDANSGTVDLSASTIGTYTVTNNIAASGGCPSVINTATITISPLPVATFTYATPYCQNAVNPSPSYSGGGVAGTFTATTGLVVNGSTGQINLSGSSIGTGTVTNTIAAANGCPDVVANAVITINPPATAAAGSPATICSGTTYALSGSIGGGASSLTWATSGTGTFNNNTLPNAVYTPSGADITAGTVTLTLNTNDPAGPCAAVSSSLVLTINPAAVVNAGIDASICAGGTKTLAGSFSGGTSNITWTTSGSGTFSNSSITNPVYTPSASDLTAGSVTLTITSNDPVGPCGVVSDFMVLTLTPKDNPSFNYSSSTFCQTGTNPTPTITGLPGGTFSANPGTLSINASNGTVNLAGSPLGTYTITYNTAGVCPNSTTHLLTITTAPSAAFSYTASPICASGTDPFPSFPVGASGGVFSSSGGLVLNSTTGEVTLATSTPGTYTVTNTIAAAGGCAVAVSTNTVQIDMAATVNASVDQNICYGTAVVLGGSIGGSAGSSTWTGGSGSYSPNATTPGATYTPSSADSTSGSITLTLTTNDPAGACPSVSDQMVIKINQPAVALANADQTICYGSSVTLAGAIGGAATSATWTGGTGSYTPDAITLGATYIPTAADSTTGSVTLTLTTNDPAGVCPAVSDQMIITINQPATINANSDQTICYGNTVTLAGVAGGSVSGGTWTGGNGTYGPSATTLGATYTPTSVDSTAGSITLTLTSDDPAGVCPAVTDQMIITINQPATSNASADQTICFGDSVHLAGVTGGSASSATWTGGTGTFSPDPITLNSSYFPTSADSAAGTVTLTLTTNDPAGVCPAVNDQMIITINQPATANAGANQTICYGTSVILAGGIGGSATSGTWTGGTGSFTPYNTTLGATYIPSAADSLAQIAVLTLTTDDPAGVCPAVTDVMVISINAPATANASSDQVICFGDTVFLAGNIGGIVNTGTWTGGTGIFTPDSVTLNAGYIPSSADSAAGSITLTLTSDDPISVCPAVSDQMTITINQPAYVTASADQTICYGSTVTLAGAIGGSATVGTWTGGNGAYSPNTNAVGATYTPTSADSAAGIITLVLSTDDPAGVCPALKDSMTITINQPATVNASASQTICYGSTVTLAGAVGGSATVGVWSGGAGTYAPNDSTLNGVYTPTSADSTAGVITLTLTTNDPVGVCPAVADTMQVTINQPVTVNANVSQTICYGSAVTLAGSVGGSATIGVWSGGNGSYAPNDSTLNGVYTPTSADSLAGTITLTLTTNDPAGVCPALSDTMQITINQPATANASADQTVCSGLSVTLAGATGGSATSGTWSGGSGTYSPNANTLGATYTPNAADSAAGSVTLTLTTNDPAGICPAVTDVMVITINPSPAAPVLTATNNVTYCDMQPISPIVANGTGTIIWSTNSTMTPVVNTGASYTPSGLPVGTTVYYLIDTLSTGCKSLSTATVSITINPTPATPTVTAGNQSYCVGATINAINTTGSSNTIWSTNSTLSPVINVGSSYTPSGLSVGSTTYYISDSTLLGCKSVSSTSVTITVNPNPTLSGTPTQSPAQCGDLNGSITGVTATGNGPFTYQWYSGSTPITGANGDSLANIGAGIYWVQIKDQNGCMVDTAQVKFTISSTSAVSASFTPSVTQGNAPVTVTFTNGSTGATTYQWIFGNGVTSSDTSSSVQATYTASGTYTVVLIASNAGGCSEVATHTIIVDAEPSIEIPNVFTPNGDNINDVFFIKTIGITDLHADIYNRWGTHIYTLNGVSGTWDGTNTRNEQNTDGTYYILLKAKDFNGKKYEKQGYVTLVR